MSKAQAARARQAFYEMIDDRDAAKRARRPVLPLGEAVVVLVVVPAADPMQAIHAAADRLLDANPAYAATCAALDAELAGILAGGLVDLDDELIAYGVQADATCFAVAMHE